MASTNTPISRQLAANQLSPGGANDVNVGEIERWASVAGGTVLGLACLRQGGLLGLGLGVLGGGLVYRGMTGH